MAKRGGKRQQGRSCRGGGMVTRFKMRGRRCLILQSDERPEQTRRILLAHRLRCAGFASDADERAA